MIKTERLSSRFNPYRGLAGLVRRKLIAGIALTLITELFALLSGFYFHANQTKLTSEGYLLLALTCLLGAIAGNLLALRLIMQSLRPMERVEKALVELADSKNFRQVRQMISGSDLSDPLIESCNLLVDRLEEAETQQLEFMGKVVHDLRSPLATMMGYAELLSDPDLRHNEAYLDKSHEVITKQGRQICEFIEDVLIAVKSEKNLHHMEPTSFNITPLIKEVIENISKQTQREILFENEVGDALVVGDAIGLREALTQLIDNSLKYSDHDQPVHVGLHACGADGWIEIPVTDHGIGMDEAELDRLFRRFGRIKNEYTRGIPGSGLGLYIVKNVIQQHNGKVTVQTRPGEGSTFTLRLPAIPRLN